MRSFLLKLIEYIKGKKFFKCIETCFLYFGLLFIFFLFQNEILALFDKTVLPVCKTITSNPYTNISFIIIIGLCVVLCVKFIISGYRISQKIILPYFVFTLIYIYCRIVCGYKSIPPLIFKCGYSDLLIIGGWVLIISARLSIVIHTYLRKKLREKNHKKISTRVKLLPDFPISTPIEDELDYFPVAQLLSDTIRNIPLGQHCSIGLIAPWGSGKTSFLNLLRHFLDSKEYLILAFNPRHSKNPSSIQEDFFNLLDGELAYYDSEFSKYLKEYLQSIDLINNTSYIKSFFNIHKTWARKEEKDNIDRIIAKHWDRIIIIIEDFDRLLKDEIIEVLKLIDGNASFSNIVFITAFDKGRTISILSSSDYTFTDKFFNLELPLPLRPYSSIFMLLETGLLNLIHDELQKEGIKGLLNNKYTIFQKYLPTIRDVKRFINMISLTYPPIEGEVDFIEYVLISLIKYKYIDEFHKIASVNIAKQSIFGNPDGQSIIPKIFETFSSYDILDDIFNVGKPVRFRSIRNPEFYNIYFHDFVYGHLKFKDLKPILDPNTDLYQVIDTFNWDSCGHDIMDYLQSCYPYEFNTSIIFERFIKVILYIHSSQKEAYYTTQVIKGLLQPQGRNMACAKYEYTDECYKQIFREFLSHIYNGFPVTITKDLIIASIDEPDSFIFSHMELLNISKIIFRSYSTKVPTTSLLHYNLMLCCITEMEPNSRKIHIDEDILHQMRNLIQQSPGGYFANFIKLQYVSSDETSNAIICDPFWTYIFKNNEDVENLIYNSSKETIPNIVLIRNFWKLYKNNDFKPIVFAGNGSVQAKIDNFLRDEISKYEIYEQIYNEYLIQRSKFIKGEITNSIFHNNCRDWLSKLEGLNLHVLSINNLIKALKEELK